MNACPLKVGKSSFPWNRDSGHPVMRSDSVGFRVVRNLETSEGF